MHFFYLSIAILAEVIATLFLKKTDGFTILIPSLVVAGGYLLAFYFLSLTLKAIPVGVSYAIWSGVGMVVISLAGWIFYKQVLDTPTLIGIGFIIIGVLIMNVFSKSVE